jgi:hypothetical protein
MFRYGAVLLFIFVLVLVLWIAADPQSRAEVRQALGAAWAALDAAGDRLEAWIDRNLPSFSWDRFVENLGVLWDWIKLGLARITVDVDLPK